MVMARLAREEGNYLVLADNFGQGEPVLSFYHNHQGIEMINW